MLEDVVKELEFNPEDDTKTAVLKAVAIGALEGLVIVGACHVLQNITGLKLTK